MSSFQIRLYQSVGGLFMPQFSRSEDQYVLLYGTGIAALKHLPSVNRSAPGESALSGRSNEAMSCRAVLPRAYIVSHPVEGEKERSRTARWPCCVKLVLDRSNLLLFYTIAAMPVSPAEPPVRHPSQKKRSERQVVSLGRESLLWSPSCRCW